MTPFLAAARQADIEVMRLLLENGADQKINTPLNITPLMLVAGIAFVDDPARTAELAGWIARLGLVAVIWFVVGPLWTTVFRRPLF